MLVQLAAERTVFKNLTGCFSSSNLNVCVCVCVMGVNISGLSCVFSPAGCLYKVPEELLVARKGRRRAWADDSVRLNETLLETLQTPQTVSSQHAEQVGVRSISGGAVYTGAFTHLKVTSTNGVKLLHFYLDHARKTKTPHAT